MITIDCCNVVLINSYYCLNNFNCLCDNKKIVISSNENVQYRVLYFNVRVLWSVVLTYLHHG